MEFHISTESSEVLKKTSSSVGEQKEKKHLHREVLFLFLLSSITGGANILRPRLKLSFFPFL